MTEPARTPEADDLSTVLPLRRRDSGRLHDQHRDDDHDRDRAEHHRDHGRDDHRIHDRQPPAEPLLRTLFGAVLRTARHDQQLTLAEVAEKAGVSIPYLSEIERGRKEPSSEMLAAVCRALGMGLLDLVSRAHLDLAEQPVQVTDTEPLRVPVHDHRRTGAGGSSGEALALAA